MYTIVLVEGDQYYTRPIVINSSFPTVYNTLEEAELQLRDISASFPKCLYVIVKWEDVGMTETEIRYTVHEKWRTR